MTDEIDLDGVEAARNLDQLFNCPCQSWLLGAGISFPAGIPLMAPLSAYIYEQAAALPDPNIATLIETLKQEIESSDNIENVLTHLSDLISLAERTVAKRQRVGELDYAHSELMTCHRTITQMIAGAIRNGLNDLGVEQSPRYQQHQEPKISVSPHYDFIKAIFDSARAGLSNRREAIHFFTTNYDTLLEDALALHGTKYSDGFSGGAVAFWEGYAKDPSISAYLTKLHGSIDWFRSRAFQRRLLRTRITDSYPERQGDEEVVIYPQASKYALSQENPFLGQFQKLRDRLIIQKSHAIFICGYSFGDEHINYEIEQALNSDNSNISIVATSQNEPSKRLRQMLDGPGSKKLYILTGAGLYHDKKGPFFKTEKGRDWWTFEGVTKILRSGLPMDIQEHF